MSSLACSIVCMVISSRSYSDVMSCAHALLRALSMIMVRVLLVLLESFTYRITRVIYRNMVVVPFPSCWCCTGFGFRVLFSIILKVSVVSLGILKICDFHRFHSYFCKEPRGPGDRNVRPKSTIPNRPTLSDNCIRRIENTSLLS